jgi:hypothetical protein
LKWTRCHAERPRHGPYDLSLTELLVDRAGDVAPTYKNGAGKSQLRFDSGWFRVTA